MASLSQIRAALAALTLGAVTFLSGVRVERTSLLGFTLDRGSNVELDEAEEEILYLSAERQSVVEEPSLHRAAEIAERTLYRRGLRGRFTVKNRVARWTSTEGSATRITTEALDTFVEIAGYLGLSTARIGNEVIVNQMPDRRAA